MAAGCAAAAVSKRALRGEFNPDLEEAYLRPQSHIMPVDWSAYKSDVAHLHDAAGRLARCEIAREALALEKKEKAQQRATRRLDQSAQCERECEVVEGRPNRDPNLDKKKNQTHKAMIEAVRWTMKNKRCNKMAAAAGPNYAALPKTILKLFPKQPQIMADSTCVKLDEPGEPDGCLRINDFKWSFGTLADGRIWLDPA